MDNTFESRVGVVVGYKHRKDENCWLGGDRSTGAPDSPASLAKAGGSDAFFFL